jgi:hypothetical protein
MIITLCGSARFEADFHMWNEILTLDGHTVFSLSVFPSSKGRKDWYTPDIKAALDLAHLHKIDASDAIFVITGQRAAPYMGESTRREIEYAFRNRKIILYSHDHVPPLPLRVIG